MTFIKKLVACLACGLAAASGSANAALILTLDDLSTAGVDLVVVDNGVGDLLSAPNAVGYAGSIGGWSFTVTTGLGNGWSDIFGIDLNSVSVSSRSGGTLRLSLTQTDLVFGPVDSGPLTINALIGGTTQGSVSYSAWADDGNAAFGQGMLLFSGNGSGAFADTGGKTVQITDPFSLTLIADITHNGMNTSSLDFAAQVPEPSSFALAGLGFGLAGWLGRRRRGTPLGAA